MKTIVLCLFTIFIFGACQRTIPVTPLIIDKTLSLTLEKRITDYGYGYGIVKDSLLTFIAFSDPSEKFLHLYDTSFHFKISTGNKGKIFSEFNMPALFQNNLINPKDSIIHLSDINLLQEKYFNPNRLISANDPTTQIHGHYLPTKLYFTNNLNLLSDSCIIGQSIEENKGIYFTYNPRTNDKEWKKFNHHFKYPDKRYEDYSYLSSICAHPIQKRIVVAFRYFDLIQLYNEKGTLIKELCFSKIQKPLLSSTASCIAPEAPLYFLSICGTAQYCYILRANKTSLELQKGETNLSGELIVMDWAGNIKNIYAVPTLLYSITVDSTDTYLYATIKDYKDLEYAYIQKYKL